MTEKPYRLPNPEKEPAAFLVIVYKALKSIEPMDREWDKIYFARCMKRTNQLLACLRQDVRMAAQCMQDLKARFEADETKWTIETVVQYSFEWRSEHEKRSDRDCLRDLVNAYNDNSIKEIIQAPPERPMLPSRVPDPVISEADRKEAIRVFEEAKKKLKESTKEIPRGVANGTAHT